MKLIISLGNPIKSDDNIGNLVLDKLQDVLKKNIENRKGHDNNIVFIRAEISPENFFYQIAELKPDIIYIIDAVDFSGSVGEVKLFEYENILTLPVTTTHTIPITMLSKFVSFSKIKLIAVQPKEIGVGETLSEELQNKFDVVCGKVKTFVNN
tara:strand:+ start:1164 stop:1622 length:459 start_codon:yes stop_codon:yes gene_type:complete